MDSQTSLLKVSLASKLDHVQAGQALSTVDRVTAVTLATSGHLVALEESAS